MAEVRIAWKEVLGPVFDYAGNISDLESALENHSRRSIRVKPDWPDECLPFAVETVPWYRYGRFLSADDCRPGSFLHYAAGDYYIQDAGSMLALRLADIQPGEKVCDLCASPGGKSTGVLEQLRGNGLLVANEAISGRLSLLDLTLQRSGFSNYVVANLDVEAMGAFESYFDCVIVDAPCSGQSMVGKGKQTLSAYSSQHIELNAARQMRIVRSAARLVKPGGRMIYSTCTFSHAENEAIVLSFLDEHRNWTTGDVAELAQWQSPVCPGAYRLFPHIDPCAGAFAAVLICADALSDSSSTCTEGNQPVRSLASKRLGKGEWTVVEDCSDLPNDSLIKLFRSMAEEPDKNKIERSGAQRCTRETYFFALKRDQLYALPETLNRQLLTYLYAGAPLAAEKLGRWEPLFASAKWIGEIAPTIELENRDAARYVAGESIRISGGAVQGWVRVLWRGRVLSWGKLTGGVLKNHFPKIFRQPVALAEGLN